MNESEIEKLREDYENLSNVSMPTDVKNKIYDVIEAKKRLPAKKGSKRMTRFWTTGGAAVAAVVIAIVGVTEVHNKGTSSVILESATSKPSASTHSPAIVKDIQPTQIQTVSIDGWGAGASGDWIHFLYNPFGTTQGRALLTALQHGKAVSDQHLAHDTGVGGESWIVLHLANGHLLKIEEAERTSATASVPDKSTFWVSLDSESTGVFIKDSSGTAEKIYLTLFQGSQSTTSQEPTWLTTLSPQSVNMMVVDGNNNDTWFQDHSLPATTITPSKVVSALKSVPVIDRKAVDASKIAGPGSHWRTNSISLSLQLNNGSTIHVSGPFSTMRVKGGPTTPVYEVTYAGPGMMASVFLKDTSGQLTKYWNQLGITEAPK